MIAADNLKKPLRKNLYANPRSESETSAIALLFATYGVPATISKSHSKTREKYENKTNTNRHVWTGAPHEQASAGVRIL